MNSEEQAAIKINGRDTIPGASRETGELEWKLRQEIGILTTQLDESGKRNSDLRFHLTQLQEDLKWCKKIIDNLSVRRFK